MKKKPRPRLLSTLFVLLVGCSDPDLSPVSNREAAQESPTSAADVARRDLATALFAVDDFRNSIQAITPLIERAHPMAWDLNAAGIAAANANDPELARGFFQRALLVEPNSAAAHFNLGQLDFLDGEIESSASHYQRSHDLAPNDVPTELALAGILTELGQVEAADAHYQKLQEVGLEFSGSWYLTILYRYGFLKLEQGLEAEGEALIRASETLRARGITAPSATDIRRGNFGRILPPTPLARKALERLDPGVFRPAEALGFPEDIRLDGLIAASLKEHWRVSPKVNDKGTIGTTGWVGWNASGIWSLDASGHKTISELGADRVLGFDIEDDGDLDLIALRGSTIDILLQQPSGWQTKQIFELPSPPSDAILEDFDHEGDLDLIIVGRFGIRFLRNDGAELEQGAFTDATQASGLETNEAFEWCSAEDFDTDQDVDFLFGSKDSIQLADNIRSGQFVWRNERLESLPIGERPIVSDVNADGRPDLVFGQTGVFLVRVDGSYKKTQSATGGFKSWILGDLDGNGEIDGITIGDTGTPSWMPGLASSLKLSIAKFDKLVALIDTDGNGAEDLVVLRGGKAALHRRDRVEKNNGFRLCLRGIKDNRQAVTAVVELRAGDRYQRIFWRHQDQRLGLGDAQKAEVLRITWPNGVVQTILDHPTGTDLVVRQKKGLIGSCPFLYAWNGQQFTFVSDVLGITPLGLPMGPGMLVSPDHDEFVLVTGEQLKAREAEDGSGNYFDLQFTEELREVTYLDKARLLVVDHPIGTEIFPNERFSFPPFPGGHTHITENPKGPISAIEVDLATGRATGRDWAAELSAIDGRFSAGFQAYEGRFQGLTKPHMLEFSFDADAVQAAQKLRLFMTGWLYWTNASVNMASARTPGVDFIPPVFSVPNGDGGWRELGPPFGFPAGKTKTMVVDLTGELDPKDPRLRVFSTLRLFWDAVRLGTDGDDAPMITTELKPTSAWLWERGFSRPVHPMPDEELEWFEWNELEETPRWNQHPGRYTKFGEVLPLLEEAEDQFVILGSGDALRLRFDASLAPALPKGWRRDFLVYLDGWAKDRDPNSIGVEFVEPMPFHAMSGFPFGPEEHFPDSQAHKAWRTKWNTRDGKAWIVPLAPNAGQ